MRQKLTYNRKNVSIVEGTTHKIRFICDHESDLDLSKCKVMFVLLDGDRQIRKKTTLEGDVVIADIDATDSLGKTTIPYECRAFGNVGEVYHVAFGDINVIKANAPIVEYSD